jgi:hypothetical protein
MDNWLAQFIRESQTTYPSINQRPIHVMGHLLFEIGNGYEYSANDGNFMVPISYGKSIAFHTFYAENTTIEYLRDFSNNSWENESVIEKNATARYEFLCRLYTNVGREFDPEELMDSVWDEEYAKFRSRYDDQVVLPNPDEFDLADTLYNTSYWVKQIRDSDMGLTKQELSNYAKVRQFDMGTNIVLRKTAQAILGAFYLIAVEENKVYVTQRIVNILSNFADKDAICE